jgi:hypothetical protein
LFWGVFCVFVEAKKLCDVDKAFFGFLLSFACFGSIVGSS